MSESEGAIIIIFWVKPALLYINLEINDKFQWQACGSFALTALKQPPLVKLLPLPAIRVVSWLLFVFIRLKVLLKTYTRPDEVELSYNLFTAGLIQQLLYSSYVSRTLRWGQRCGQTGVCQLTAAGCLKSDLTCEVIFIFTLHLVAVSPLCLLTTGPVFMLTEAELVFCSALEMFSKFNRVFP